MLDKRLQIKFPRLRDRPNKSANRPRERPTQTIEETLGWNEETIEYRNGSNWRLQSN